MLAYKIICQRHLNKLKRKFKNNKSTYTGESEENMKNLFFNLNYIVLKN